MLKSNMSVLHSASHKLDKIELSLNSIFVHTRLTRVVCRQNSWTDSFFKKLQIEASDADAHADDMLR